MEFPINRIECGKISALETLTKQIRINETYTTEQSNVLLDRICSMIRVNVSTFPYRVTRLVNSVFEFK